MESCGCPCEVISMRDCRVTFRDLDHKEKYFPMVSRAGIDTFFGVPAAPLSPDRPGSVRCKVTVRSARPVIVDDSPPLLPEDLSPETSGSRTTRDSVDSDSDPSSRDLPISGNLSDAISVDINSAPSPRLENSVACVRNDEAKWDTWNTQDLLRMTRDLFSLSKNKSSCAVSVPIHE
jgi:hypothetical protein